MVVNKEIMNIIYHPMLNEHPFITSILKSSIWSHYSFETTYQGTVIIPFVKDI
jgi:hypothetical protein